MMQQNGGEENNYKEAMTDAINAAKAQAATEAVGKALGGTIGFLAAVFLLPLVAVYAWNGLTPESFPDWQYLPAVAGFLVGRILLCWVKAR